MVVSYVIGRMIGGIAEHVIDQHIENYKEKHPIPDPENPESDALQAVNQASQPEGEKRQTPRAAA